VADTRVLIIGGSGLAGGYIASALLARTDTSVVLGARDECRLRDAATKLAAQHDSERVSTVVVAAANPASLKQAAEGVDLIVVAAHANRYGALIGRAALDAGADVIDITYAPGDAHPMTWLRAEAEQAGRCLVTDAGMLPGLAAFLVRLAGGRLDPLETAFVGGTSSNPDGWPEQTVAELVELLADPPMLVWRDGAWRRSRFVGMADQRTFDFGPQWGRRKCTPLFAPEMHDLPKSFPSLREAGTFSAFNGFVDGVALPLAMVGMRVAPRRAHGPASRLVGWGIRRFARPPYGGVLKVDATGMWDGQSAEVSVTVSHPNEYQATGLVVAAYVAQWSDGLGTPARAPGVHPMGMLVDPERFLKDLTAAGFATT